MQTGMHNKLQDHDKPDTLSLLSAGQARVGGALMLIALGIVFLLGQANLLNYGSSWWVIFLAIPGLMLLWAAFTTYQHSRAFNARVGAQVIVGAVLVLLSIIFIFDPTWSFTRGLNIDIPFLRSINWDRVWPWFLIVPGVALLYSAYRSRVLGTGVVGAVLVVIGLVFVLDISWNVVWPLVIVAIGVWLLTGARPKRS
ncbi:MAG: hypothetical protein IT324_05050 [Anaerolineae bacterium]|nr:hypothetical protein [Anaerolineae bacterium]